MSDMTEHQGGPGLVMSATSDHASLVTSLPARTATEMPSEFIVNSVSRSPTSKSDTEPPLLMCLNTFVGLSVGSLLLSLLVLCLSDMWGSRLQVQAMQCHLRALQVRLAMSQARRLHPHTHRSQSYPRQRSNFSQH
ncbi:TPA: hypothetical protein ACH3X2_000292 [Trebouxia sp. C0005]